MKVWLMRNGSTISGTETIVTCAFVCLMMFAFADIGSNARAEDITPYAEVWHRTWGGSEYDIGYDVIEYDGDIYATGFTRSFDSGYSDICLLKYDYKGDLLWERTWGREEVHDHGYGIAEWGGFLYITGYTYGHGAGASDIVLLKYSPDGDLIWFKTWGGLSFDHGYGLTEFGGSLYVVGETWSYGAGSYDVCLVKFDYEGNVVWSRTWGGEDHDYGYGIFGEGDHVYLTGETRNFGSGESDVCILKYDIEGNFIWQSFWGGGDTDSGRDLVVLDDHVYATGHTESFGEGTSSVILVKSTLDGEILWNRTWGGFDGDNGRSIVTVDEHLYITGSTFSHTTGSSDISLLEYDRDGNLQWELLWGGEDYDQGYGLCPSGRSLFVTGQTWSYGKGYSDVGTFRFETDSDHDGRADSLDIFPSDSTQWADFDGDGYGDNADGNQPDAFPEDRTQWADSDGDGYGDNTLGNNPDEFPGNPLEWNDYDGDGTGDNSDAFPGDITQWRDTDGDGFGDNKYGNNADAFPYDALEWKDSDGDGAGDNSDYAPHIPNIYFHILVIFLVFALLVSALTHRRNQQLTLRDQAEEKVSEIRLRILEMKGMGIDTAEVEELLELALEEMEGSE